MKKKSFYLSILCVLAFFVFTINVYATDVVVQNISLTQNNTSTQSKIICKATLEDDFVDDSVIVVINKEYSKRETTFTPSHFKNIEISEIRSITSPISDLSTESATAEEAAWKSNTLALTDVENFRQIIEIKLKNTGKGNVLKAIKELEKIDYIESAEPNYIFTVPSEPDLNKKQAASTQDELTEAAQSTPNISNDLNSQQYALDLVDVSRAWGIETGDESVLVGIIDSGIINHPDLSDNLVAGWDFYNNNSITTDDPTGHGTHVAGIIGANGNVQGVAKNVSLVPLQVVYYEPLPEGGGEYLYHSDAIDDAVEYARRNKIPIINCSFGAYAETRSYKAAMENYEGLIVCSAGNDSEDTDNNHHAPSGFSFNNIISVAATTRHDVLADFSNYGATSVDLAAPGGNVYSTYLNNTYASLSGTSMAAPYVTGVAALLKSKYPNLTAVQIKEKILNGVDEVSTLAGKCVEGGRLNAYNALRYADQYYTIKYNANGGMGVMADTRVYYGTPTVTKENRYGRFDYEFECWYIQRNTDNKWRYKNYDTGENGWYTEGQQPSGMEKYRYEDGVSVATTINSPGAVITFHAQWSPIFTIVYEKNGGSGTMEDTTVIYGHSTQLRANTFIRDGYTFDCWHVYRESDNKWRYRNPDDTSQSGFYVEGSQPEGWVKYRYVDAGYVSATSSVAGDVIHLYAQWKKHFFIRYDANGGSGSMPKTKVIYGEKTYLSPNTFTRDGFEFLFWYAKRGSDNTWRYQNPNNTAQTGWYLEGEQPEGWTKYPYYDAGWVAKTASNPGETVTFYAQWKLTYRIQYNANGGEGTMPDTVGYIIDGESGIIQLPECAFTREGYDFSGWYIYDVIYEVWAYTEDGCYIEWFFEGEEPDGYYKYIIGDQSDYNVANDEPITHMLYAVWLEK